MPRVLPRPDQVKVVCPVPVKFLSRPGRENVCLLHGSVARDGSVQIIRIQPVPNEVRSDNQHDTFKVSFRAVPTIVGVLHSHPPEDRPVPSLADRQGLRCWMLGGVFHLHPPSGKWNIYWFSSWWAENKRPNQHGIGGSLTGMI